MFAFWLSLAFYAGAALWLDGLPRVLVPLSTPALQNVRGRLGEYASGMEQRRLAGGGAQG